jgi:pimeloyl-ACP methyl ester carboxylesterase
MEDSYIEIDGCNIRYRDTGGDGPTVLLIHGIGASLEIWNRQFELIGPAMRLIALDLPGHGLSDFGQQPYEPGKFSEFCWRFLDKLDVRHVFLVGNSMGGGIALLMAANRQQRVSGLVLVDAATLGREAPGAFRIMTLPLLGKIMSKPGEMALQQQISAMFHNPATADSDVRRTILRNGARSGGQKAFLATLRLMTDLGGQRHSMLTRAQKALASLSMTVLFIHGRQDKVVALQHSIDAQRMTPGSQLMILENCGHIPQLEKPDEFNAALTGLVFG